MKVTDWRRRFQRAGALLLAAASVPAGGGFGATGSVTQTVSAYFSPFARVWTSGPAQMVGDGQPFSPFQATVPVSFRARTTASGGGTITLQVTSDFTPGGGPSATGALSYVCAAASMGSPCSGVQTASTSVQTPVLTLPASAYTGGGNPCSAQDPNSVTLTFAMPDDPTFDTGSYSATITFFVSAT